MKDKILEAVQISKTYGEGESAVQALKASDLTIWKGEFASIIGSSGSGKSTLLKILGGLLPPTTGNVLLDGQDIYAMNAEQLAQVRRQKIGFIFQDFRLFPEYTVRDNILLPLVLALAMRAVTPRLHRELGSRQSVSFYIWAVSLFIVVGRSVSFIMAEPADRIPEIVALALGAGVVCALQFLVGRRIGAHYGDRISGAQGLGQKNTVLAIWLALTYLNPVSSVGPAAYIAWQNTINSVQLYYRQKREAPVQKDA